MTETTKLHVLVKMNYLPRTIATLFMILICGLKLGVNLFEFSYVWLFALGAFYPHLAYLLSKRSKDGKRQELWNMHFDGFLVGVALSMDPDLYLLTAMLLIISVNGLYIGAFKLLATTLLAYSAGLAIGLGYFWPFTGFIEIDGTIKLTISIFVFLYLCNLAIASHHLVKRMKVLNTEVKRLSSIDSLTGAYNRRYLDDNLSKEISRSERLGYPLTIILADIDHFKQINDKFGHQIGDKVLIKFVEIAKACIRDNTDWLARFGGEEFIVVLPNADSEYGAVVAERIRKEVDAYQFEFNGEEVSLSCSFGVAAIDKEHSLATDCLVALADSGLYRAKAKGRNCVEVMDVCYEMENKQAV